MSLLLCGAGAAVDAAGGGGGGFSVPTGTQGWFEPSVANMFTDTGTTHVATAGDTVRQFNDISGVGNHAGSPSAGERGTYQITSGKPCLRLDGVDDRIYSGAGVNTLDGSGQHWTAISCTIVDVDLAAQRLMTIFQDSGGFSEISWMRCLAGVPHVSSFSNVGGGLDDTAAALTDGVPFVLFSQITTAVLEGFKDNVSDGGQTLTDPRQLGSAYVVVGADSANSIHCAMDVFGWGFGQGVLSAPERLSVFNRLASLHP
jgi:hypothetical protein